MSGCQDCPPGGFCPPCAAHYGREDTVQAARRSVVDYNTVKDAEHRQGRARPADALTDEEG